jgi:hypothetical protein
VLVSSQSLKQYMNKNFWDFRENCKFQQYLQHKIQCWNKCWLQLLNRFQAAFNPVLQLIYNWYITVFRKYKYHLNSITNIPREYTKEEISARGSLFGATETETNALTWVKLTLPCDSFSFSIMSPLKLNSPKWCLPVRSCD